MPDKKEIVEKYKRIAGDYDREYDARLTGIWDEILAELELPKNGRVLDLGCGTGYAMSRIMSGFGGYALRFDGVDLSPDMIDKARTKCSAAVGKGGHEVRLHCQDCLEYLRKCGRDQYDLAVASFILAYVKASKLFPLVHGILKKSGKFIILTTSRGHGSKVEKEVWRFGFTHPFRIKWWKVFTKGFTVLPPAEKIAALLRDLGFSRIEGHQEPIYVKIEFNDAKAFVKWLDASSLVTQYFDVIRGEKEAMIDELLKYCEARKIDVLGEPIRIGRPFVFKWPIYKIIATK
jgi:SAM-dependent methyltransferase